MSDSREAIPLPDLPAWMTEAINEADYPERVLELDRLTREVLDQRKAEEIIARYWLVDDEG